ncbi:hypothetical protein BHE74_00043410, partial [Ensete ventricosum]
KLVEGDRGLSGVRRELAEGDRELIGSSPGAYKGDQELARNMPRVYRKMVKSLSEVHRRMLGSSLGVRKIN